jgi:competence ComEA-like helix-hairpin-helix protein
VIVLSAALVVALAGMPQDAADLPEGPGKSAVVKFCDNCHGLDKFAADRKSKSDWESTLTQMADEGLELSDEEYETIIGYLSKYLSKVNVNQATAAELAARLEISAKEAEAIVQYRERHGAFKDWHEIAKVDGVDARKIETKKDVIEL